MYKVILKPSNEVIEVDGSINLLEALREKGVYIKSSCGGVASCSDCIVKILSGEDHLEPPPFEEIQYLGNVFHITKERLACQLKINGDVTLDIAHHDENADAERLRQKTSKKNTKVRKKEDLKVEAPKEEKPVEEPEWVKHWDKDPKDKKLKKLGGGKKPHLFRTDHLEEEEKETAKKEAKDFRKARKK
jgi:ferredoxin